MSWEAGDVRLQPGRAHPMVGLSIAGPSCVSVGLDPVSARTMEKRQASFFRELAPPL